MVQFTRLNQVAERKRVLVAQSEIYRHTLKLEVQNIRLYGGRIRQKFDLVRLVNPLFVIAGALIGSRFLGKKFRREQRRESSLLGTGLALLQLLRAAAPLVQKLWTAEPHTRDTPAKSASGTER